jgi:penicillin-binding protein 1A
VSVETALARSINTVAVRLAQEAGGARIGDLAARFGFTTLPAVPDLSVALGAYEVSVLQMAAGYAVFQNAGGRVDPWIVAEVRTLDGRPLYVRPPGAPVPVYEPQRAAQMVRMMRKVITSGTGTRAALDRPAAGKTGTSQNWRDAWFAGFTPDFTTVVWVGDDQARAMDRVTGGALPADIWRTVMLAAHQGLPVRDFDWAAPPPLPPAEVPEAGPREQFYQDLAADFAQAERAADGEDPGG